MPRKNEKLRDQVRAWMVSTMKHCPVEKTTLARLAATHFRLDYQPGWVDKMAEEITFEHTH